MTDFQLLSRNEDIFSKEVLVLPNFLFTFAFPNGGRGDKRREISGYLFWLRPGLLKKISFYP
jgi:hypothetical protein